MRRRVPLLVLLYVTLDFANPLMPGAVRFEAGSIEVVQADRTARAARPGTPLARLVAVVPTWSALPVEATLGRPAPVPPAATAFRARHTVRRTWPRRRTRPRPASEDH